MTDPLAPAAFNLKSIRVAWLKAFTDAALRAGARCIRTEHGPKGTFYVTVTVRCGDRVNADGVPYWATIGFSLQGGTGAGSIFGTWNVGKPLCFGPAMGVNADVNPYHFGKATVLVNASLAAFALCDQIALIRSGAALSSEREAQKAAEYAARGWPIAS